MFASTARRLHLTDSYGMSTLGVVVSLVSSITVVILIALLAGVLGGRAYGRTTCKNWSAQTGIDTKFAVLNWADSGQCLAKTPDGRWVLNSKWQAFVSANH